MIKARVYLAGLALAAASAAHAGVSFTPAVTSDYDFRGISQSAAAPAVSLSADYTISALHVGAWTSNIDWGTGFKKMELDILADYTFGSDETAKVNVGIVDYLYPGMSDQNTPEAWVTVSKSYFSASVHYANDWFNLSKAWYYEANGTFPIGSSGFGIGAHVGHSAGDAWKGIEYTDYSVSGTYSVHNFSFALKYVGSDAPELTGAQQLSAFGKKHVFETEDRVILTISTTLPWAKAE
jgi:uncharacterized protein (TIGR02001 family)